MHTMVWHRNHHACMFLGKGCWSSPGSTCATHTHYLPMSQPQRRLQCPILQCIVVVMLPCYVVDERKQVVQALTHIIHNVGQDLEEVQTNARTLRRVLIGCVQMISSQTPDESYVPREKSLHTHDSTSGLCTVNHCCKKYTYAPGLHLTVARGSKSTQDAESKGDPTTPFSTEVQCRQNT
jgi:hypothetical protein